MLRGLRFRMRRGKAQGETHGGISKGDFLSMTSIVTNPGEILLQARDATTLGPSHYGRAPVYFRPIPRAPAREPPVYPATNTQSLEQH